MNISETTAQIEFGRLSKKEIEQLIDERIEDVIASEDPLKLLVKARRAEHFLTTLISRIREAAIDEFDKYGEKEVSLENANLSKIEAGTKYDYSKDDVWNELKAVETVAANQRKEREAILKALKNPMEEFNEDTGEIRKIYPAVKTSTTTIKVKI